MFNRALIEAKAKVCLDAGGAYERECAAEPGAVAAKWMAAEKRRICDILTLLFEKPGRCVIFHPRSGRFLASFEVPVYPVYIKLLREELVASGFFAELRVSEGSECEHSLGVCKAQEDHDEAAGRPMSKSYLCFAALSQYSLPMHFDFLAFVKAQKDETTTTPQVD